MTKYILCLGIALTVSAVTPIIAQTQTPPPPELRERFEKGIMLYNSGEYQAAMALFAKNLAVDSKSKGSLLYTALAHIQLGEFVEANEMVDRFLQLEPNDLEGLIAAIKTKQALSKSAEVDVLRKRLFDAREKGLDPRLRVMMSYEREVIYQSDGSRISILENFEPSGKYVWLYLILDKDKKTIKRRLELASVPTSAKAYVLGETQSGSAGISGYKIHKTYNDLPDYNNAKVAALGILLGK